jgi:hypothetical protein
MDFELRPLTRDEWLLWDNLVEKAPGGTVFHKSYWLPQVEGSFIIFGCFRGGELYGGVPIVYRKKLGIRIASRLFTPYSGFLFKDGNSKYVTKLSTERKLSRQLARRLKSDFDVVSLGYAPGPVDLQPFIWEGFSTSVQYTYIMKLRGSLEELWMGMEETTRTSIRKAENNGISIVTSDDFDQTFNVMHKIYTSSKAAYFNRNEVLAGRNQCKSFLAKDEQGKNVAGLYIVWDNKRSYYLLGGRDSENGHYGASALAIWEAIKFTKENLGLAEFDFLGSMIPQVERFFRGFGGQLNVRFGARWVKPYLKIALLPDALKNIFRNSFPLIICCLLLKLPFMNDFIASLGQ